MFALQNSTFIEFYHKKKKNCCKLLDKSPTAHIASAQSCQLHSVIPGLQESAHFFFLVPRPPNAAHQSSAYAQTLRIVPRKDKKNFTRDGPHPRSVPRVRLCVPWLRARGTPRDVPFSLCVPRLAMVLILWFFWWGLCDLYMAMNLEIYSTPTVQHFKTK